MTRIQVRRGLVANLPLVGMLPGEPHFTFDSQELLFGNDAGTALLPLKIKVANISDLGKGEANGVASLDATGKVPSSQLPSSVLGAMEYQGTWNATSNTPAIPAASASNKGYYYKVATAGTTAIDGCNDWQIGDWIVSNGSSWDKIDNTDMISSVNGQTGNVSLTTSTIPESINLYYTDTRARAAVSATTPLQYNSATGAFSISAANGTTNGYLSSTDWATFNGKANINSPSFTGTPTAPTPATADSSTTLATTAFVKNQGYIASDQKGVANGVAGLDASGKVPTDQLPAAVLGAMEYQGTWNAATNVPAIPAASASNKGYYYKVATAGTTLLNGCNDWQVGDWVVSNGAEWDKIDNTDLVSSVNGQTGAVVLNTTNVAEGTNLYYTNARADARIALQRGAANGLAPLDASSLLPAAYLPTIDGGTF